MLKKKIMCFIALFSCVVLLFSSSCGSGTSSKENSNNSNNSTVCQHEYEITEHYEPTCLKSGYDVYTCKHCKLSYIKTGEAALSHDFGAWEDKTEACCATNGTKERECKRCHYKETEDIFVEHTFSLTEHVAPTCTAGGYDLYTCSVCGKTKKITYDIRGHIPKDAGTKLAPTCTKEGYTTFVCKDCGKTYIDRYVSPTGHNYSGGTTKEVLSSCDSYGYTLKTCTICNHEEFFDVVLNKPSHDFDENGVCKNCKKPVEECFALTFSHKNAKVWAKQTEESLENATEYLVYAPDNSSYPTTITIEKNILEALAKKGFTKLNLLAGSPLGEYISLEFALPSGAKKNANLFGQGFCNEQATTGDISFAENNSLLDTIDDSGLKIRLGYNWVGNSSMGISWSLPNGVLDSILLRVTYSK